MSKSNLKPGYKKPSSVKKPKPKPDPVGKVADAFAYYYSLLDERSLKKVAIKFDAPLATIKTWSSRYGWKNRVLQMDIEYAERVKEKMLEQAANQTVADLKIIERLHTRFEGLLDRALLLKDEKTGEVRKIDESEALSLIRDIDDFSKLVKLRRLLTDKPTEIIDDKNKYVVISAVPSSKPEDPEAD